MPLVGYFAGPPLTRRPGAGRGRGPIIPSFKMDLMEDFIKYGGEDIINAPRWLVNKVTKNWQEDWEDAFTPQVKPKGMTSQELEDYGEESQENLPGSFGLKAPNFLKLMEDPLGEAQKAVNKAFETVTDWDDIENRYEEKMWRAVVFGTDPAALGLGGEQAVEAITNRTKTQFYGKAGRSITSPLSLRDPAINSSYMSTGDTVIDLVRSMDSPAVRDKKYNAYLKSSAKSISYEIGDQIKAYKTAPTMSDEDALLAFVSSQNIGTNAAEKQAAVRGLQQFVAKKKFGDTIGGVNGSIDDLTSGLSKIALEGAGTAGANVREVEAAFDKLEKNLLASEAQLAAVEATLNAKQLDAFRKLTQPYNDLLAQIRSIAVDDKGGSITQNYVASAKVRGLVDRLGRDNVSGRVEAQALMNNFSFATKGGLTGMALTGGNILSPSFEHKFYQSLVEDGLLRADGTLDFQGIGALGNLLNLEGVKRLQVYSRRLKIEREQAAFVEFMNAWSGGKLFDTYMWPRFRARLNGFTPAYMANEFFKRSHYFGLVVDYNILADTSRKKFILFQAIENTIQKSGFFSNDVHVKVQVGANTIATAVKGGEHMQGAIDLYAVWKNNKLSDDDMKWILSLNFTMTNGVYSSLSAGDIARLERLLGDNIDAFKDLFAKVQQFKDWLLKQNLPFNINDAENLFAFFKAVNLAQLSPDRLGISITQGCIGLLQKLGISLNLAQTEVLKRVAKYIAPLVYIKTTIAEGIADAVAAAFAAGGLATGGIADLLTGVVRNVTRWLVVKTLDSLEALGQAMMKLDFSKVFKGWEKTFEAFVKTAMYASFIPLFLILVVFFLLIGVTSAFSPTNPAKADANYITAGGGVSLGSTDPSACPINNFGINTFSYTYGDPNRHEDFRQHGTNAYWESTIGCTTDGVGHCIPPYGYGGNACNFTLPLLSGRPNYNNPAWGPSTDGASYCSLVPDTESHYGYAIDVGITDDITVYLPRMVTSTPAEPVEKFIDSWTVSDKLNKPNQEASVTVVGTDQDGDCYTLLFYHLDTTTVAAPGTYPAGTGVAELCDTREGDDCDFGVHLHLEMAAGCASNDYVYVDPYQWLCHL